SSNLYVGLTAMAGGMLGILLAPRIMVLGVILGDMRENMGERYTLYYDEGTERSERFEQSLKQLGHFDVEPLPAEPKPRRRHEDMTQQTAYCL
ncbi:MAG: hypothetical protein IIT41_05890, partial [Oscillospiraceae bacterium]|nr:hypothetical protein [Oscillospiraceae bacterium]